jgi:NtrC-family two-component system sensor histidine kinase KinB
MGNDTAGLPPSSLIASTSKHQSSLAAVANELHSLVGQDPKTIAYNFFTALVHATDVKSGRLFLTNDNGAPEYCLILVDGVQEELTGITSPPVMDQGLAGRIYHQRRGAVIHNTAEDPRWSAWAEFPETATAGSAVAVPIMTSAQPIGALVLASKQAGRFDEHSLTVIKSLANQVANIIEITRLNSLVNEQDATLAASKQRLAQTTTRRLRELAFLNETGQAITSTLDLERILHLLLERVRELLEIDAVSIALRHDQTNELVFEAASGEGATDIIGVRLKPGQGIAGWVAETGKPLVVQDVYSDTRFFPEIDQLTGMQTQAILCIPILLKGRVVGVIEALNPGEIPFDEQAIDLLNALSGLAASAIENARLFTQVRSAEARYESLFEESANPIIITDLKGNIIEVNRNACTLLDKTKETLCGTNIAHVQSVAGNLDFVSPLEQMQTSHETSFQTVLLSDGHRTTVEIKVTKVQIKETTLLQWIGRDISAETELEQTREDMVRMMVHDLRNPLANIMNSLDVLYDVITEKDTSISKEELLTIAKRSGKRMHQLISSILDISRLETGQAILATQPTSLEPLLRDALEFIKPQTDIRDISLTAQIEPNLPQLDIDGDMISRVVLNVLDNACKFTQMGGEIALEAFRREGVVQVEITDNGTGVHPTHLESMFEKFSRLRGQEGPKGTGLGLAFCKLAVEAQGGRIWAESELGQGTTIHLTLPIEPPT